MTTFELEPYKKIIVRSTMRFDSPEDFVRNMTIVVPRGTVGRIGNLFWANGIMFRHFPYVPTDSTSKQNILGNLYLDHVEYALMPAFRPEIRNGEISIALTDVSNHTTFAGLTKWIMQKVEKRKVK